MDPYFFLYWLPKNISRREDRARETDGLRVKWQLVQVAGQIAQNK